MRQSLFGKIVTLVIILLAIIFVLTGVFLNSYMGMTLVNEKSVTMQSSIELASEVYEKYAPSIDMASIRTFFNKYLDTVRHNTGADIWIVDSNGRIMYYSSLPDLLSQDVYADGPEFFLNKRKYIDMVFSSGDEGIVDIGNFDGMFTLRNDSVLTVAKPKLFFNGYDRESYAIIAFSRMSEVSDLRKRLLDMYVFWAVVAIVVAILIVYMITSKMIRPITKIKEAAKLVAGGDLTQRVIVDTNDEIGDLAKNFNIMAEALHEHDRLRKDFVANVSHDLRTPITSIKGFVQAILDGTIKQDKQEHFLTVVKEEADRMGNMVENLLDLSKLESGKLDLEPTTFDAVELLRLCVIKLEPLLLEKKLNIDFKTSSERLMVEADKSLIERVVINILGNAIKFSNADGDIQIELEDVNEKVFVSIIDNGEGMDVQEQNSVFERFYKVDRSRGKNKEGTGLGLSIVKEIIKLHKEKIWVKSEPGKGCNFTFTLTKK